MSDLVFMMWVADVVSVSRGMGFIGFVLSVFAGAWFVLHKIAVGQKDDGVPKPSKLLVFLAFFFCMTAWLMPSKQTIYAAVALKAGSEVVESRIGQKAANALEAILDEVIAKKGEK